MPHVKSVLIWDGTTPAHAESDSNKAYASRLIGYEGEGQNTYGYTHLKMGQSDLTVSGMSRGVTAPSQSTSQRTRTGSRTFRFEVWYADRIHMLWNEERLRLYIPLRGDAEYTITDPGDLRRFRERIGRKRREAFDLVSQFVDQSFSPDWTEFVQSLVVDSDQVNLRLDVDLFDNDSAKLATHLQRMGVKPLRRGREVPTPRRLFM